jgi:hypothetical protein
VPDPLQTAFAGIDVAFAKRKRLPVAVCIRAGSRITPLHLTGREAPTPPVGRGNAATLDAAGLFSFAQEVMVYLRDVERHFAVRIQRIGIDAPSRARSTEIKRRRAEVALDSRRISCFTTPSTEDFIRIREKAVAHLASGGAESRLPRANQLWMLVGFALFERLAMEWECLEVFPQATVCVLGANAIHKSRMGGIAAQSMAVALRTGWPNPPFEEAIKAAVYGSVHDGLDAYMSAWVAALEPIERVALGCPPDDVIWVPAVDGDSSGR